MPFAPDRLFKYVTFERLDVLQNECIHFTQPAALNDPWELKPYLEKLVTEKFIDEDILTPVFNRPIEELVDDALKQNWEKLSRYQQAQIPGGYPALRQMAIIHFKANPKEVEQVFAAARAEISEAMITLNPQGAQMFIDSLCDSFGILSLTTKPDNDLMWSHYAWNHTGMVVEFDASHDFFTHRQSEHDDLSGPKPIVYSSQRPAFDSFMDLVELEKRVGSKSWEPLVLTKKENWAYEDEWRMIRLLKSADKIIDAVSPSIHLFNLPAACVSGLILGAKMPDDKRQAVVDFILSDPRYVHVSLSQAKISNRTFALDIEPLT